MKILVCGSREFSDYDLFSRHMDEYFTSLNPNEVELVSGGARGADQLAQRYAEEHQIKFTAFPAKWDEYGRSAGYVRNSEMAKYCAGPKSQCIAFWDGRSLGTKHMMKEALRTRMSVVKVLVNEKLK